MDEEPQPAKQGADGDGITLYEEYRGFFLADGRHRRLSPQDKELLYLDPANLLSVPAWKAATGGILAYRVTATQVQGTGGPDASRIVNFNSGFGAARPKYAVNIVRVNGLDLPAAGASPQAVGEAENTLGATSGNGSNSTAEWCKIWPTRIQRFVRDHLPNTIRRAMADPNSGPGQEWKKMGLPPWMAQRALTALARPNVQQNLIEQMTTLVTVHEVGHACGIDHHRGDPTGGSNCPTRYFTGKDKLTLGVLEVLFPKNQTMPFGTGELCKTGDNCWGTLRIKDP